MVSSHGEFDQPFQTTDITTGQMLHQGSGRSRFQAISPNGEFILWGQTSQSFLKLSRSTSHDVVGQLEVQSPLRPANPVWSPDGKHVAFAAYDSTVTGNGETDYTSSTLWVADVDSIGAVPQFGNVRRVVQPSAPFDVATYPSFTPDSKWVVHMRAEHSKSSHGQGQLWMTSLDGTQHRQLKIAGGEGLQKDEGNQSYGPSVSPVMMGGYYWVSFVARRTYGNSVTIPATEPSKTLPAKLWMAAIRPNSKEGEDPSYPAFFVDRQEEESVFSNHRLSFTLNSCLPSGESCQTGSDCCDGFCRPSAGELGDMVCTPPSGSCSQTLEACSSSSDCCNGQCVNGYCDVGIVIN